MEIKTNNADKVLKDLEGLQTSDVLNSLKDSYFKIIDILKYYIDTAEENYHLIAIWIIGTYLHDSFPSYPFLFFNAMKGSGKTRTIKIIIVLSNNGRLVMDLTDAVLFRTAKNHTLGIDELEDINSKERGTLRTLLNASYKRGVKVIRMVKKRNKDGESMVPEEFEVYCPIVMANINGLNEVLEDRCITIIQEKTDNERINLLVEDFEDNKDISEACECLEVNKVKLVQLVNQDDILKQWNNYVNSMFQETTQSTETTLITQEYRDIFDKIYESGVNGRHLELFFPLFIISSLVGEEFLDKTIQTARVIVDEKKQEDIIESRDVSLISFVATMESTLKYVPIANVTNNFREYIGDGVDESINSRWIGRALKRLGLVVEKRRIGSGIQVILNVTKAKNKMKLFEKSD